MKILLCEDDNNIATISRLSLESIGHHQVTWVTDGQQALEHAVTHAYDVILLDDMMPKLSGVAVCAALVKSGKKVAPIIFMSANSQDQRVIEFSSLAIGYIAKPFDPLTLNQQIEKLLAGAESRAV